MPDHNSKPSIKYFISYAEKDKILALQLIELLETHLQGAKNYKFEGWHYKNKKNLVVWDDFHEAIEKAIDACDFGILLISPAFFASDYILQNELPKFISEDVSKLKLKKAIPVGLKKVDFKNHDMKGVEKKQIYLFEDKRGNNRFFGDRGLSKDEFVLDLFLNIITFIEKHFPSTSETPDREELYKPGDLVPEVEGLNGVKISKGRFLYGDGNQEILIDYDYEIGTFPVINKEYAKFIKENPDIAIPDNWDRNTRTFPEELTNHPVTFVSWNDATEYCNWKTRRDNNGFIYKLPTEREWEKAARGQEGNVYPWGKDFNPWRCNSAESDYKKTTPVTTYSEGKSPYGCYDMAGNVWEWCEDKWLEDKIPDFRVVRGGSFSVPGANVRSAFRFRRDPGIREGMTGFRIVRLKEEIVNHKVADQPVKPPPVQHKDEYGHYIDVEINKITQRFRWIEDGTFYMGSPENESGRENNELQHKVTLTKGFWLADTACTQELWEAVMGKGANPSINKGKQKPVENVNRENVNSFIKNLKSLISMSLSFRLPTEAEWEYSCRAKSLKGVFATQVWEEKLPFENPFYFGINITTDQANFDGTKQGQAGIFRNTTSPVKFFPCNEWGLYEMHGNVWEWCADGIYSYSSEHVIDPSNPSDTGKIVIRGGCYTENAHNLRSARRDCCPSTDHYGTIGFRLALDYIENPAPLKKEGHKKIIKTIKAEKSGQTKETPKNRRKGNAEPSNTDKTAVSADINAIFNPTIKNTLEIIRKKVLYILNSQEFATILPILKSKTGIHANDNAIICNELLQQAQKILCDLISNIGDALNDFLKSKIGKRAESTDKHSLWETTVELMGWLVLLCVNKENVERHINRKDIVIEFPYSEDATIEIVLSWTNQTPARFIFSDNKDKKGIPIKAPLNHTLNSSYDIIEEGFNPDETADAIKKDIWNKVLSEEYGFILSDSPPDIFNKEYNDYLNELLKMHWDKGKKHYFTVRSDNKRSPLNHRNIIDCLKKDLSALCIVRINQDNQDLLMINPGSLLARIGSIIKLEKEL